MPCPQLSKGSELDSDLVLQLRDAAGNPYYHNGNNQGMGSEQLDPTIAGPSAGAAAAAAAGPRVVLRCRAVEVDPAGRVAEAAAGVRAPVSGVPLVYRECVAALRCAFSGGWGGWGRRGCEGGGERTRDYVLW